MRTKGAARRNTASSGQRKLSRFSERSYRREKVREVEHAETKDGSALLPQAMLPARRPAALQQLSGDELALQPAPGEGRCSLVPELCSRNDWPASWSFHTAPPCGGSIPAPRGSLSHPEEHTP